MSHVNSHDVPLHLGDPCAGVVHDAQVPPQQLPPPVQGIRSVASPVSVHTLPVPPHMTFPVWQGEGMHAAPLTHGTHLPSSQTSCALQLHASALASPPVCVS